MQGWAAAGRQPSRDCARACGGRGSWVGILLPGSGVCVRTRVRVPKTQWCLEHMASAEVGGARNAGFGSWGLAGMRY